METNCNARDCGNNLFYKAVYDGEDKLLCTECNYMRDDPRKAKPPISSGSTGAVGYISLIDKLEEYVAFLTKIKKKDALFCGLHGMRDSQEDIEEGKRLQKEITI
jgi:hypothetical protein